MSLHRQESVSRSDTLPRWYAWCFCGVVGPIRANRLAAVLDESAHHEVCTARKEPS